MRAARRENYRAGCVQVLAFLGRYAHQPVDVMLNLPITLLHELADATAQLLEGERDQLQNTVATGGGG